MVGAVVLGAGVLGFGLAQSTISALNNENADIAARIKAIETSRYSLPSSVSSNVAGSCAAIAAIGALGTLATPTSDATAKTEMDKFINAAAAAGC